MQRANINDRQSVEALYGCADFDQDAARNSRPGAAIWYGVRIESSPDEAGWFALSRAQHHVGEVRGQDSAFLFPHEASLQRAGPGDGAPSAPEDTPASRRDDYEAFIDRVLQSARSARFPNPIGRGEERLKGFHGG